MAENIINVKVKQRTDTESNWTSKNPVLLDGEHGYVKGSGKYKIGDGTKKWSELSYYESLNTTDKTKLDGIAAGATKVTDSTVAGWGYKKTDTWRGVQNNLTSTATDQSLSAYQGKVLKDLVDKKTTFTYSSTQPTSPASNAVWIG